ncbi:HSP20-like chaperone [Glarea lozoyensis ATCC 20868]|uniref:HSP20-like chaperone n=1 Tax=Glarea lozoyensis (strain ATCC 20868 / MF5171) TaxID=1116229 RepID=S3D5E2_GLAL2|nr:HSP20-like chaperone [Glarea lozoyensis ATCC 20868]EPE33000.1 HSP20-like chaperone [Glarea lozoyensis ATCC 20868]
MAAFYAYPPDFYYTTSVPKSYPVHHHAFEQTRHKLGHLLKNLEDSPPYHIPKADIRETPDSFSIDVELPGFEATEEVKLRWTNSRTLMLDAYPHDAHAKPAEASAVPVMSTAEEGHSFISNDAAKGGKKDDDKAAEESEHVTLNERWHGRVVRAFSFPVDVQHGALHAKLRAGVLRMTVPKVEGSEVIESPKVVKG